MNTLSPDRSTLDRAAGFAREAFRASLVIESFASSGLDADDTDLIAQFATDGVNASRSAILALESLGASLPEMPATEPVPLHLLNTPDTRALLAGLSDLLPVAERIDAARGRALDDSFAGDARGLDLADALASLITRLTTEVHGMQGRD